MRIPSIEAAVRSAFSWSMVRLFGGEQRMPIPDWRARPYRILFIRDDGIGDLMVTMELLRAITEISPTITLDVLASPQNAGFARTLPFVNEVIVHKRGFLLKAWPTWRRLRRNRYDVVVDGRVAIANVNKQTLCLILSTGAPWRIGRAGRRNDRVYSVPIEMPRIEHWVDAIVSAGRPRILINLYSASADRQWPLERFGPVIRAARERLPEAVIVIPTMPGGDAAAARLAQEGGAVAMPLSLPEVTAVTATADLVISPDTAITVIASAFHVPVLALMR
jgi:ADP-heptose:LPS heptosyltransferase